MAEFLTLVWVISASYLGYALATAMNWASGEANPFLVILALFLVIGILPTYSYSNKNKNRRK